RQGERSITCFVDGRRCRQRETGACGARSPPLRATLSASQIAYSSSRIRLCFLALKIGKSKKRMFRAAVSAAMAQLMLPSIVAALVLRAIVGLLCAGLSRRALQYTIATWS